MSNKTKNIQKIKVGRYEPNLATVHDTEYIYALPVSI